MKHLFLAALMLTLACGGAPPAQAPEAKTDAPKPKPPDESRRFPKENQTAMQLVDDRMLGKEYLPGGNLAAYQKDGKTYQLFLIVMKDAETASLTMFDLKGKLTGAKFIPSFGGYFGVDGEQPWFVFAKGKHLAGVVGLSQDEADLVAREFAAKIPAN
jgi:hypothetical protein